MKILKIRIKNINCLRGEWEIDFQSPPLSAAGLFAITGPTGSGKSTILDSITLALFNKIPRFETDIISQNFIEKAGSILTRNETDCFAEVDYSCNTGMFRSKWSIARNKRGGLRANDMELTDISAGQIVAQGKRDVPQKNTDLIGLSYDQFIKSILLSQGEFARFLKSTKDERGKLLEDITGSTLYRELGRKAFEKFKEKNEAVKSQIDIIESEESQLLPKEKEDELNELIEKIKKEIRIKEDRIGILEKTIETKNNIERIEGEISNQTKDEEQINTMLQRFKEKNLQRISKHEKLLPYLNDIRNYSSNNDSIKNVTAEIESEEPLLKIKSEEVNKTLNEITNLIGSKAEMNNAIDALTKFRDRVIFLLTNKINAQKAFDLQKIKITTYFKNPKLTQYKKYEAGDRAKELKLKVSNEIIAIASTIESLLKRTNVKPENIPQQKDKLDARLRAMEDLKFQVENFTENRKKLSEKDKQIKEITDRIEIIRPQVHKILEQKTSINLKIKEVRDEREKKMREQNLEEQRNLLKAGEPCPLCGSTHHPYLHEYVDTVSSLTNELQNLENDERKYDIEIQSLEKQISMNSGTLEALEKEKKAIDKEVEQQKSKIELHKKQLDIEKVGNVQTLEAGVTELENFIKTINELEKLGTSKRELEDFKEAVDLFESRIIDLEKTKKEVESRYKGSNIRGDCDSLGDKLKRLKDAILQTEERIKSNKTRLDELKKHQTKIEDSLSNIVSSLGYANILVPFNDILPDVEFNSLKQEISELEGNLKQVKALIEDANRRKQQLLSKDESKKSKEDLSAEHTETLGELDQHKRNLSGQLAQKMQNENRQNRIIKLKQQVEGTRQANFKWELLSKYIGDAQGKNFSTFAQGLTLKKLIVLANDRLKNLNDRYLLDTPHEEEDDDLVIIDTYLGEERRSVKTLSGGETFLVSLALALALSDLASKNVKIESLYIDEGFGSLDPDALDTAISTLEQLQIESNKTIGIISHVDSLKERIETQIQLEKSSSGFSSMVIKQL